MKFDTHTHVILNNDDLKHIITKYLQEEGYRVEKPADIQFTIVQHEQYSEAEVRGCFVVCKKEGK